MAISSIPDPYKALGLTPEATAAEIRSAYKKLMLKCHPDKVHDESQKEEKAQQYQKVMEAYELLSDPKKKRKYDLDMQRHAGSESRPTSATPAADPAAKAETRDTSEDGRKEKSRERAQRHESSRSARRGYEHEEYHRQGEVPKEKEIPREAEMPRENEVPREKEIPREKDVPREREAPKEREIPKEREVPKERDIPREMPPRESDYHRDRELPREKEKPREKESSRDRERIHKEYKENKEQSHSRDSSKEKERKHSIRPETGSPPISDAYKLHQQKYEEERRAEEEKLQRVRNVRLYGDPNGKPAEREQRGGLERENLERERLRYEYDMQQKLRKNREAREYVRAQESEELDGFNMDDIHPKGTESRRGSTQKRETSPKDSPTSSRERKSSHSPSHRKESVSPVRGESLHSSSSRPMPIRTPYGSAPPPVGSTFASSSASPRRRHSVSSQDPMKAPRLYPREDSGYSSPNYPGTPMGPDGKVPSLMRSSTESSDRGPGWKEYAFKVYVRDEPDALAAAEAHAAVLAAAAGSYAYSVPMPGHLPRRKTTSHHPLETANLTSSPPLPSGEFRKAGIPTSSSGSPAYNHYPSPTSAYYASPTHHFSHSSGASSVHPQQSPSRSHSSRHTSSPSYHHSASPHSSPKVPQDGFAVNGHVMRSPSISGASTVHPAASYHYARTEYFTPPSVLPSRNTL